MKTQLEFLERSTLQMQDRIRDLDSLFRLTVEKNVAYQADLKVALADMMDKMNTIDGRLTDIESQMANRPGSYVQTPVRPNATTAATDTAKATDESDMPQVNPSSVYENATKDMREGRFDLAILQFNEFLKQFPDSPQADDAQYWLAECYYAKKEYARAIPEFEKVEKTYPQSDKLTESIFKLGRCYQETGNVARARPIFNRLIKDYPDSFEARQAQDRLKEME
ncbi:MAG: tol-pal system protein YbgF [candidate division Zixibacteria bacterium]|nr:tol-pal system protein YbgF [candidate division Zixibacteria bacterium]